jgi:tRNA pseudouridine38-40 synthase
MALIRVALVVAYDGTSFAGWQWQEGLRTVSGELERALGLVSGLVNGGGRVAVMGSGRTDAGVHALGQVAHADLARVPGNLRYRLNSLVAGDLRVLGALPIDAAFHARRSATGKRYRYRFDAGTVASPLGSRFAWHVGSRLDHAAMADAARRFEGHRDFSSLQSTGSSVSTTLREIHSCQVEGEAPTLSLVVEGSGFLRHMVRAMAGSLVEVGLGRFPPEWIDELLGARDRAAAGPNAPPQGLILEAVHYPEPFASALARAAAADDDRASRTGSMKSGDA